MGNKVMGKFRKARHQGFQEDQIGYLKDKWDLISENDIIDIEKFAVSYNITKDEAIKFVKFMDLDQTGKVDQYKFKVASAILCQSHPGDTAKLLFKIYDTDKDGALNEKELSIFTNSLLIGLAYYNEDPKPSPKQVLEKNQSLITKWGFETKNKTLTENEFISMLQKDPEILQLLFEYGFITRAEVDRELVDYNDIDSDLEVEMERRQVVRDERIERIKSGIEHNETATGSGEFGLEEEEIATPWKDKAKGQTPSGYKQTPDLQNPPNAYLELDYVYGYRCHDTRNNLRYGVKGEVVYHTAGVGIVMDSTNMTQQHYSEHSDDITCLDIYENMVLTGQHGLTPLLMIWDINTLKLISVWKDQLTNGIANCSFSNNGKLVVAVAMDDDHSIAIYNIQIGIAFRMDPKNSDNGLVASGKMTKREVFDIKFIPKNYAVLVACMKEINIVTWKDGKILSERCIWQDQKPQAALTIAFLNDQFVTGMFSGQLLVWEYNQFDRSIKAHAQPVQAMWTRSGGRGIITATKRGIIMIWNDTFACESEFDTRDIGLGPNLSYPPGPAITSVCESLTGQILFGTRRSEIVEVQPFMRGQNIVAKLLMQGHFKGELWGLAVNPKNQHFYTVGEDELLAQWDADHKRIINYVDCEYASKTLDVSSDGKLLAVGMANGRVFIYNAVTLAKISDIKDYLDPDKEIISIVKFSRNSEILAVTYCRPFNNIVFYSTKTKIFTKINEIKNLPATVSCLDFSNDSKYIQVNLQNNDTMYYTVGDAKELKSGQSILKDEQWFTWTCIFGWQVQGIWPKCSSGSDINSCDRSSQGNVLVTGDDFGKVKLFQYPCPVESTGSGKYTGHSSFVQNVRFTSKDKYVISVGGDELSIFQWKFVNHKEEKLIIDHAAIEAAEAIEREKSKHLQEPEFEVAEVQQGDMALAVKPFLGEMKASIPSWYKPNAKRDNVLPKGNLSIHHVMGFRYFYILDECRDMCAWTDKDNTIAFATATLGVVMDIKSLDQTFYNVHEEDVVSFAMHPSRKIIATGQMAQAGKAKCIDIFVWDIDTKKQLAHFNDFHLAAIVFLKFSPNGNLLLSVGQDDDNSLAIHDWQANRMLATSNIDKAKVNCVAWKTDDVFATVGNKHVKFWTLQGKNCLGKMGAMGGKFESQFSITYAFKNTICVTGSGGGNLFAWSGGSAGKPIPAHKGKVQTLKMDDSKNVLYSGGMDGSIVSWGYEGGNLVKKQDIYVNAKGSRFDHGITAMDFHPKTGTFLVGTANAQIFTFDPAKTTVEKKNIIQQGHFQDELWAACVSPDSLFFVTAGADCTVRLWNIREKLMVHCTNPFDQDIRAVDWAMDKDSKYQFIICADYYGTVYLLDAHTLAVSDKQDTEFTAKSKIAITKKQSTCWVEDIKVSPDGKFCAFGAHGGASKVLMWNIVWDGKNPKFGKVRHSINAGLSSALLHVDWSVDSNTALVNSQAYEMKFIDMRNLKNARSSECKDIEFATWTCKLGFPVQGIFPGVDYSDVNTVCRSQSKKYLATGEDTQKVVLMQYPVVEAKQQRKEYIGHSSHVTRVRFTFDDNFMISTGGLDKTIIIWKTDFGSEKLGEYKKEDFKGFQEEGDDDICAIAPKKKPHVDVEADEQNDDEIFPYEHVSHGDQFMAVKPWMGAIKEPTPPFYDDKKLGFTPPKCEISIEYVYGYRSKDMRSNVYYLKNDKILYNAAALAIILDSETNTQTFFDKHEDDITAIDMNPVDRMTVATGELGAKPSIYVWDAGTLQVKCQFKAPLKKGIVSLAFTPDGKKLVGGAVDEKHCIAVFDVSGTGSVLWTGEGGPDTIIDLRWTSDKSYTTIGVKHYYVWSTEDGKTFKKGAKGEFGKASNRLSGVAVNGNETICGASNGEVQVWKGATFGQSIAACPAPKVAPVQEEGKAPVVPQKDYHTKSCDCIHVSADYVMSGAMDGLILVFDKKYQLIKQIDCKELFPDSVMAAVRAIYVHPEKKMILVGTLGSEIYQITFDTPKIIPTTKFELVKILMKGHFSPNLQWTNEVWGLDIHRDKNNLFVTCSDDGTFRVWDADLRKQVDIGFSTFDKDLKPEKRDHATGDYQDMCKARVIAVAPNGSGFVLGMKDGTMRVFDEKCVQTKVFKKAKEWISDIKFSPDGTSMVYGSHDNALYAVKWPKLTPIGKGPMNKHSSYITHFDYSCDGVNLHSTCGAYELLFWDVNGAKQLPGGASALKDEKWHTWTVTLGWPVQGIWPECTDGTDINSVDRSNATIDGKSDTKTSYHLLATGDDFSKVRILRYPSIRKSSEAVVGRGHSSHVTNVRFNFDDTKIFSTGGEDQCVIQWKVTKK